MYEDLVSLFDFPLLKSEEQYKAELQKAGSAVIPVYRQDAAVADKVIEQLAAADFGAYASVKPLIGLQLEALYSRGVLPNSSSHKDVDGLIYLQRDMRAGKVPAAEVYTVDDVSAILRDVVSEAYPDKDVDSLYNYILSSLVIPDLTFDQQMTDLISEENIVGAEEALLRELFE